MFHPDLIHHEASLRVREDLDAAATRRRHPRRPRPPSRVRAAVASQLVRLAARVADEPVTTVARRAA
ncbi:hypothetical protein [Egicoccus sp. AB-alg6-2]|uniref:hypothetical protein n=1 Tax=Egicoccus sp. AB-alg6-2 TaxID=3242692 RepID=UPI00359E2013